MNLRATRATLGLVTAISLIGLAGCGNTQETARAAGIVPSDVVAFVSINLAPSIAQKQHIQSILSKFPYKGSKQDFQTQLDKALSAAISQEGLDYQHDVKPWLGSEVAVGVLSGTPTAVVAIVKSKDDAKAKAALDKAKAKPGSAFNFRMVRSFAVITDSKHAAALDKVAAVKTDADSLAGQAKFTRLEAGLQNDRLVVGWLDGKKGLDALRSTGRAAIPFATDSVFPTDGFVAFDVHAADNAAIMEAVAQLPKTGVGSGDPQLSSGLPADSLGAVTVFDLSASFDQAIKSLGAFVGDATKMQQQIEQATGINLQRDVLSWMHGEAVLVAGPAGAGTFPEFGLLVAPSDKAAAQAGVAKLQAALGKAGLPVTQQQVAGVNATVAGSAIVRGIQPAFALFNDRFVLASSPAYLAILAKSSSSSITDTPEYRHAVGSTKKGTSIQILLRAAPIRDALLQAFGAGARANYEKQAAKYVEPLEALALRVFIDGTLQRSEMKVTFK